MDSSQRASRDEGGPARVPSATARRDAPPSRSDVERILDDPARVVPVFQPIASLVDGRVVGFEALARFPGTIAASPRAVLGVARDLGRDAELEAALVRRAIQVAGQAGQPAGSFLSVNVSPRLLAHTAVWRELRDVHGERLVIELTEDDSVDDYPSLRRAIRRYRRQGIRFAIDDTGAGFASLRHLTELSPAFVKLDAELSRRIGRDRRRQALVRALAEVTVDLGSTLIIEGVELAADLGHLARSGLDALVQGYAVAPPGPPWPAVRDEARSVLCDGCRAVDGAAIATVARPRQATAVSVQIEQGVNIGVALAAALRQSGIESLDRLRTLGAVVAWERLRDNRSTVASARALLALEGAVRGVRWWQLPYPDQSRLLRIAAERGAPPVGTRRSPER